MSKSGWKGIVGLAVGLGVVMLAVVSGVTLKAGEGQQAVADFQKIIATRWLSYPLGALARLQLGRAYALSRDNAKARAAYQDFIALWKDADPDIPILKQAKAEYAKLQ
jgi:hypothetical protein